MYILNNLSQFLSNSSNYTKDVVVFFDGLYKDTKNKIFMADLNDDSKVLLNCVIESIKKEN